jgi:hypothetical protein
MRECSQKPCCLYTARNNTHKPISYSFPDMSLISRQPRNVLEKGYAGGTTQEVCTGGGLAGTIGIVGDLLWDGLPGTSPRKIPREKIQDFSKI